jgi:hypothetical protein
MRMKTYVIATLLLISITPSLRAQNAIKDIANQASQPMAGLPDSLKKTWTLGGLITLSFSQGSSSNWAAGAQDFTMALNTVDNFFAVYKRGRVRWDNTFNVNYGFTQTSDLGLQKSSDLWDLTSRYSYQLDSSHWSASLMFDGRSQFTNGYNYYTNQQGKDSNQLISKAFAPAYFLLSPGFTYTPVAYFSIFLSPASSRITVCTDKDLSPNFGLDTGKSVLYQFGAYASITYNHAIAKNVVYNGRLDLYTNYLKQFGDINVYWTNQLAFKINKLLSATYSMSIIYDDNATRPDGSLWGTQFQSLLGIGLALKL